jgi:hypothetical protein
LKDSQRNVHAGELEVRPPAAPTTEAKERADHPTEAIATLDTSLGALCRQRHRRTCRLGRREGQRSMWPVAVVMLHEDVEKPLKMLGVQDQRPVETP